MKKTLIILTISVLAYSCDLFTTRDAEDPNQNRSNFVTPSSASLVIQNLKNSLADKNIQNYLACFVDTLYALKQFTFSASSEALIQYQMQGWGKNEENIYISAVVNKVPKDFDIVLNLTDTVYSNLGGDSVIYSAKYDLTVPFDGSNPVLYSGNLEFKLLLDNRSLWAIYFWKDTKSQANPSWSELKGSYY